MKLGTVANLKPETLKVNKANRKIDHKHVARLKNAINANNLLHINPLKVNPKLEIIDGQHRWAAALDLELATVPCLIVGANADDAIVLNLHAKNWSAMDFARYWASKGKKPYQTFVEFKEETALHPSHCMFILGKGNSRHMANFRKGAFAISELTAAYEFVARLDDFRDLLPEGMNRRRNFMFALWQVIAQTPGYDHDKMLKNVRKRGLKATTDVAFYMEQLKNAYHGKGGERNEQ